jgi:hypothetical protein
MTTYTAIPNADIDQDSPVTQPLMTALRDNPIAITEGATGAPRMVAAGIEGGDVSTAGEVYYSDGDGTGTWGSAENIEATKSLDPDGYVKLPGGVILQWGRIESTIDTAESFNFPIAFTTVCWTVSGTFEGYSQPAAISSITTTGFSFNRNNSVDGTDYFRYIAIGY